MAIYSRVEWRRALGAGMTKLRCKGGYEEKDIAKALGERVFVSILQTGARGGMYKKRAWRYFFSSEYLCENNTECGTR